MKTYRGDRGGVGGTVSIFYGVRPLWGNPPLCIYQLRESMFPVAEDAYLNMISIPLYTAMSDEQQDRIIDALHEALG